MSANRSLDVSFHGFRGFGADQEPDLFRWRRRFGWVTVSLCNVELLAKLREVRAEVIRLRGLIASAISASKRER